MEVRRIEDNALEWRNVLSLDSTFLKSNVRCLQKFVLADDWLTAYKAIRQCRELLDSQNVRDSIQLYVTFKADSR